MYVYILHMGGSKPLAMPRMHIQISLRVVGSGAGSRPST